MKKLKAGLALVAVLAFLLVCLVPLSGMAAAEGNPAVSPAPAAEEPAAQPTSAPSAYSEETQTAALIQPCDESGNAISASEYPFTQTCAQGVNPTPIFVKAPVGSTVVTLKSAETGINSLDWAPTDMEGVYRGIFSPVLMYPRSNNAFQYKIALQGGSASDAVTALVKVGEVHRSLPDYAKTVAGQKPVTIVAPVGAAVMLGEVYKGKDFEQIPLSITSPVDSITLMGAVWSDENAGGAFAGTTNGYVPAIDNQYVATYTVPATAADTAVKVWGSPATEGSDVGSVPTTYLHPFEIQGATLEAPEVTTAQGQAGSQVSFTAPSWNAAITEPVDNYILQVVPGSVKNAGQSVPDSTLAVETASPAKLGEAPTTFQVTVPEAAKNGDVYTFELQVAQNGTPLDGQNAIGYTLNAFTSDSEFTQDTADQVINLEAGQSLPDGTALVWNTTQFTAPEGDVTYTVTGTEPASAPTLAVTSNDIGCALAAGPFNNGGTVRYTIQAVASDGTVLDSATLTVNVAGGFELTAGPGATAQPGDTNVSLTYNWKDAKSPEAAVYVVTAAPSNHSTLMPVNTAPTAASAVGTLTFATTPDAPGTYTYTIAAYEPSAVDPAQADMTKSISSCEVTLVVTDKPFEGRLEKMPASATVNPTMLEVGTQGQLAVQWAGDTPESASYVWTAASGTPALPQADIGALTEVALPVPSASDAGASWTYTVQAMDPASQTPIGQPVSFQIQIAASQPTAEPSTQPTIPPEPTTAPAGPAVEGSVADYPDLPSTEAKTDNTVSVVEGQGDLPVLKVVPAVPGDYNYTWFSDGTRLSNTGSTYQVTPADVTGQPTIICEVSTKADPNASTPVRFQVQTVSRNDVRLISDPAHESATQSAQVNPGKQTTDKSLQVAWFPNCPPDLGPGETLEYNWTVVQTPADDAYITLNGTHKLKEGQNLSSGDSQKMTLTALSDEGLYELDCTATVTSADGTTRTWTARFLRNAGNVVANIVARNSAKATVTSPDDNFGMVLSGPSLIATKEGNTAEGTLELVSYEPASKPYELQIVNRDGRMLAGSKVVVTGDKVVLIDPANGSTLDSVTIVVRGDVIGTGRISLSQLVRMATAYRGESDLKGPYSIASDWVGRTNVTLTDLVREAELYRNEILSI